MGANYAEAVYEQWGHLPSAHIRLMVRMALVAPDRKAHPRYWGGWEVLAYAMGYDLRWQTDESPEAQRLRSNAKRNVLRILQYLADSGAIARVASGRPGRRAVYELNIRPVDKRRYAETDG